MSINYKYLYAEANYGKKEINSVIDVLKNSRHYLMGGKKTKILEKKVSKLFQSKYGLMTNSGSSSNLLAIKSFNFPKGSEVITPALTFSTTVSPIIHADLIPVFVDVHFKTLQINEKLIEKAITAKTVAIMAPNLIGNISDWKELKKIASKHNLFLIEDSADTIGYKTKNRYKRADVTTTSFYASHIVTCGGFGGAICIDDPELARRARLLRGWGRSSSVLGESEAPEDRFNTDVNGIEYDAKFVFEAQGYNFLPSEMAAAFGLVQLDRLREYTERRVRNFEALTAFFESYEDWFILPRQTPETHTPWLAVPIITRDNAPFTRRQLQVYFESQGIQTRTVFTGNILRQPGFRNIDCRIDPAGYPNADQVMRGGLLLGCHQGMGASEIEIIKDSFKTFVESI